MEESPSTEVIAGYIDWSPFFWTWEFKGKFPTIFEHRDYGQEARKLYEDALVILERLIKDERLKLRGVWSMLPAVATGDDIRLRRLRARQHYSGCDNKEHRESIYRCLADYLPETSESGGNLGLFAVTAGDGIELIAQEFRDEGDDYSAIIVQALGDRAEATAEWLHAKVRRHWGQAEGRRRNRELHKPTLKK